MLYDISVRGIPPANADGAYSKARKMVTDRWTEGYRPKFVSIKVYEVENSIEDRWNVRITAVEDAAHTEETGT